eukprot:915183-Pelagomonas_calceolata.AAC.1
MDGCSNERLLDQGIQVPENISRAIPDCVFPYGTPCGRGGEKMPSIGGSRWEALSLMHTAERQA